MKKLNDGYRRFRSRRWLQMRSLYEKLAEGQSPSVAVIACCDSRTDPSAIFDAQPGELFVIRNVANLVPPYEEKEGLHGTSAAIEFAVEKLKVDTILVMGHRQCGGVAASLNDAPEGVFIDGWIHLLDAAKDRLPHNCPDAQEALEQESVRVSLERLLSFPFVARAVQAGRLRLVGAVFGVADGRLLRLDAESGKFAPWESLRAASDR